MPDRPRCRRAPFTPHSASPAPCDRISCSSASSPRARCSCRARLSRRSQRWTPLPSRPSSPPRASAPARRHPTHRSPERTIAIDERLAAELGLRVGDRVVLAGRADDPGGDTVRVSAIARRSADPSEVARSDYRVRLHLTQLQRLAGYGDRVDRFAVATDAAPARRRWRCAGQRRRLRLSRPPLHRHRRRDLAHLRGGQPLPSRHRRHHHRGQRHLPALHHAAQGGGAAARRRRAAADRHLARLRGAQRSCAEASMIALAGSGARRPRRVDRVVDRERALPGGLHDAAAFAIITPEHRAARGRALRGARHRRRAAGRRAAGAHAAARAVPSLTRRAASTTDPTHARAPRRRLRPASSRPHAARRARRRGRVGDAARHGHALHRHARVLPRAARRARLPAPHHAARHAALRHRGDDQRRSGARAHARRESRRGRQSRRCSAPRSASRAGDSALSARRLGVHPAVQGDYELRARARAARRRPTRWWRTRSCSSAPAPRSATRCSSPPATTRSCAAGWDAPARRRGRGALRLPAADQPAAALPLATLQAMGGAASTRSRVGRHGARAPGADVERLRALDRRDRAARERSISTATALAAWTSGSSYFRQLAFILGAVSLVVGLLLVTTLVTVSVNERLGEIAVLRAIGVAARRDRRADRARGAGAHPARRRARPRPRAGDGALSERASCATFPACRRPSISSSSSRSAAVAVARRCWSSVACSPASYPAWRARSLPIAGTLREEAVA